jgi:catechol 2,3-dioxygenase-like lactoylglutathione lyase family enzyme
MLRSLSVLALAAASMFSTLSAQIVGVGTFIHVVKDLDQTIRFYGTGLGLEMRNPGPPPAFAPNALVESLYDAKGSQSRVAVFKIPNSPLGLEFVEFKGISQTPVARGIQDPGANLLVMPVGDAATAMARLKVNGATVVNATTVADPDGFFVELAGPVPARLLLTVAALDQTLHVFRDLLGFQPETTVSDGRLRTSRTKVPGTDFEVEFREFDASRTFIKQIKNATIHDPGSGVLRLMTPDVDGLLEKLKAVGVPVASAGGEAASLNGRHFVILRDPDNFFFQLVPGVATVPSAVPAK